MMMFFIFYLGINYLVSEWKHGCLATSALWGITRTITEFIN